MSDGEITELSPLEGQLVEAFRMSQLDRFDGARRDQFGGPDAIDYQRHVARFRAYGLMLQIALDTGAGDQIGD